MPNSRKLRHERKLPVQQLSILAICRFAEPIASTSLFPYLPEMIKSFGVPEDEIGKWAGLCSAMFSLCQAIMGIPWGVFSDRYGRKPAILLGLTTTMLTSLMWGFSTSLPVAIVARGIAGAGNGNVGIIRTTVAEMVPFKELQPRAFSIMPLVWNTGSIFGPTIGGALANPFSVKPGEQREGGSLLERFPYALPNIVAAVIFLVGITTGLLFLHETLETLEDRRDYGLVLGSKVVSSVKRHARKAKDLLRSGNTNDAVDEQEPLLQATHIADEETLLFEPKEPPPPPPKYTKVLNRQAVLNLVVYTLLALHNMGFDQLLPVYLHRPPMSDKPTSGHPLKFAGGFGLNHFEIGLLTTCYGVVGMLIQFLLFPPVARRFGVLNCLKACGVAFPIAYFLTPFTALLPTTRSRVGAMFAVMIIKCFCSIFAFPCSTILLTNSASSLRVLGTLNGFATSTSAIGRAIGPFIGGYMFSKGVEAGYVIVPWWLFTVIAVIAALPIWSLVEGEGFGGEDDHVSDAESIEEGEHALIEETVDAGAEVHGRPLLPHVYQDPEEEEESYDDIGALSRTTTMSMSSALSAEPEGDDARRTLAGGGPSAGPSLSRRSSKRVMRRISIPVGMGEQGISRRYSSNLGQSLGSAASYNG